MRIAGAYTSRQLLRLKLRVGLPCLLVGAMGLWGSQHLIQNRQTRFQLDRLTEIEVSAFLPFLAAFTYGWSLWMDGWRVLEFICDERSFRFRKLRGGRESRDLSEIVRVHLEYCRTTYVRGCPGYTVRFQDGEEVLLGLNLPNVDALAGWLEARIQPEHAPPS
jgi:hypothetical protein